MRDFHGLLQTMKDRYKEEYGQQSLLKKQSEEKAQLAKKLHDETIQYRTEAEVVKKISSSAREEGMGVLEKVSTEAVQAVLGDNLAVKIEIGSRGATPTADLVLQAKYGDETVETDPASEEGGGIADMVSLSAFQAIRLLSGKDNRAPFFLDEPSKYVSAEKAPEVAGFLKRMGEYSGVQTFVVTHEKEYLPAVADAVFQIAKENGISHVMNKTEAVLEPSGK
jgi:hypothetical protein